MNKKTMTLRMIILVSFAVICFMGVDRFASFVVAQEPPTVIVEAYQLPPNSPLPTPLSPLVIDTLGDALPVEQFFDTVDSLVTNCIVSLKPVALSGGNDGAVSEIESVKCGFTLDYMRQVVAASSWVRVDYSGSNRTGSQLIQTTSNQAGCSDGSVYVLPDYSTLGWSNLSSSTESNIGKGCARTISYDNTWYGGSQLTSSPYSGTMGAMDNHTDSSWTGK